MISNVFKSLITRPLVPAMLALVAATAGYGSSAEARAGQQAADSPQSSATPTVRSTRYGRILFDGRGRALSCAKTSTRSAAPGWWCGRMASSSDSRPLGREKVGVGWPSRHPR